MTFLKCYLCLAVASCLLYFALKFFNQTQDLLDAGIQTEAVVYNLIEKRSSDGSTYTPIFEYKDLNGESVVYEYDISSNPAAFKRGQKVGLVYSEDSDERKIISYWGLYRWTIILIALASPFVVIGSGFILFKMCY